MPSRRPRRRGDGRHAVARGADGRGRSVAGFIEAAATDPLDVIGFALKSAGRGGPSGQPPRRGRSGGADPIPAGPPAPDVGGASTTPRRTVDGPRRRGARHQLRRAALTDCGSSCDRARPHAVALPRALQPDISAAVSRRSSGGPSSTVRPSTRCRMRFRASAWSTFKPQPIGCRLPAAGLTPLLHPPRTHDESAHRPYVLAIGTVEPRKGPPRPRGGLRPDRRLGSRRRAEDRRADRPGGRTKYHRRPRTRPATRSAHPPRRVDRRQELAHCGGTAPLAYPSLYERIRTPPPRGHGPGRSGRRQHRRGHPRSSRGMPHLLVPPHDVAALSEALLHVWLQRLRPASNVDRRRQPRARRFPWERAGRQLASLDRTLAERPSPRTHDRIEDVQTLAHAGRTRRTRRTRVRGRHPVAGRPDRAPGRIERWWGRRGQILEALGVAWLPWLTARVVTLFGNEAWPRFEVRHFHISTPRRCSIALRVLGPDAGWYQSIAAHGYGRFPGRPPGSSLFAVVDRGLSDVTR